VKKELISISPCPKKRGFNFCMAPSIKTIANSTAKIAQCMNDLNAELQGYPQQWGTKFFDKKLLN
jgi:hypothetical protein